MNSLSVVVFKNGKVQPHAKVQLDGPGGRQTLETNQAGAVVFSGLKPGRYIVNSAHGPTYLGTAAIRVGGDKRSVIWIKYPPPKPKAALTVSVSWQRSRRPVPNASVSIRGPSLETVTADSLGKAHFSKLDTGGYSVAARVNDGGNLVVGFASVTVSGGRAFAFVSLPEAAAEPTRSTTRPKDWHRQNRDRLRAHQLKNEIVQLQVERKQKKAESHRKRGNYKSMNKANHPSMKANRPDVGGKFADEVQRDMYQHSTDVQKIDKRLREIDLEIKQLRKEVRRLESSVPTTYQVP